MKKRDKFHHIYQNENYLFIPIKSIETEDYEGVVYNFETESHTYLTNGFITHNCDGAAFHSNAEQQQRDAERDQKLARRGWLVVRFKDTEIEDQLPAVMESINKYIGMRSQQLKNITSKKGQK